MSTQTSAAAIAATTRDLSPEAEALRQRIASRLTLDQACEVLGLSRWTLCERIRRGTLKAYKEPGPKGRYSFELADVEASAAHEAEIDQ